jgi:hypothetical protein
MVNFQRAATLLRPGSSRPEPGRRTPARVARASASAVTHLDVGACHCRIRGHLLCRLFARYDLWSHGYGRGARSIRLARLRKNAGRPQVGVNLLGECPTIDLSSWVTPSRFHRCAIPSSGSVSPVMRLRGRDDEFLDRRATALRGPGLKHVRYSSAKRLPQESAFRKNTVHAIEASATMSSINA